MARFAFSTIARRYKLMALTSNVRIHGKQVNVSGTFTNTASTQVVAVGYLENPSLTVTSGAGVTSTVEFSNTFDAATYPATATWIPWSLGVVPAATSLCNTYIGRCEAFRLTSSGATAGNYVVTGFTRE